MELIYLSFGLVFYCLLDFGGRFRNDNLLQCLSLGGADTQRSFPRISDLRYEHLACSGFQCVAVALVSVGVPKS